MARITARCDLFGMDHLQEVKPVLAKLIAPARLSVVESIPPGQFILLPFLGLYSAIAGRAAGLRKLIGW